MGASQSAIVINAPSILEDNSLPSIIEGEEPDEDQGKTQVHSSVMCDVLCRFFASRTDAHGESLLSSTMTLVHRN